MGQKVHKKYPDFKVKEFGYSTFQKFVSHLPSLELVTESGSVKRLMEKEADSAKKTAETSKKLPFAKKKKSKGGK